MMRLSILILGLALTACGSANKQDISEVARNPSVQPPVESQTEFERRCALGNVDRVPGVLRNNRSICLIQMGTFIKTDYSVNNFVEQQDEALKAVPKGGVIYGDYDGPANGPEVVVNSQIIGKGQIALTQVPVGGRLSLLIYGGFYKRLNYFSGVCFSRGNSSVACPIPLNP